MLLSEGQMNDHKGAGLMIDALPPARELLADRGYDANGFRAALVAKAITPCIPPRKNRKVVIAYDKTLYRQRHRIDTAFGRLKDWRRIATRYDRCAHTCFSAICIAAGSDSAAMSRTVRPRSFRSTPPCRERLQRLRHAAQLGAVSIHAPVQGATSREKGALMPALFRSTPPCRERRE